VIRFLAGARDIGVYFLKSDCAAYLAFYSMDPMVDTEVKWLELKADECNLRQRCGLKTSLLHIPSERE
jgi:hypothetical protein